VVGTPAYMAPEQAVSERNAITTATDVYGLGAVLYALLAGKAPFRGDSIFDTLTQVKEREPERPRSANANVPRDLETICLKCLQKEPQRRYESAAALADDLQRWLNGEPITARPVGRTERLWRWCRRQPIQAALAAGLILAVACGFILVFWQWRRAEDNLEASNKSNREANQATQQAQERQLEADENFLLAHDAVKDVTAILESSGELERRGLDPLRRDLLLKAQSYYRKFLERRQHDPALKKELAQASATLADILRQTGTAAEAIEAYEQALLHCEALLNDQPDNLITRLAQAELNNQLSSVYGSINRQDRSVEYLKTAQKIVDECLKLQPEDTNLIVRAAVMVQNIGVSHAAAGRSDNALKCYAQTKKTLERLAANDPYNERFQESLAHVLFAIGSEHTARGESTEALNAFREAVEKSEALANRHPQQRKLAHAFAQQLCFLADCLLGREEPKEALSHLLRAQEILADLTRANAAMTEYQVTMGLCCSMIATASVEVNELKQADEAVQKARSIFSRLMKDFPDVPDYPYRLIWVLINMARGHEKLKHLQKANDIYEEAEDLSTRLVNRHSNDSRYEFQLGEVLHNLAVVQSGLGRPGDARELILKALKSEQKLFDKQPGNTRARLRLSLNYSLLASLNRDLGFFNEAIDAIQKRHKLWPNSPTELYDVAEDYAITSAASKADINLQKRCADLALEALRQAIQAGFHDFKNAQANPNLAVLRSRPEFQQILAEMNKKP
jgi:tetratricopeptide (TPR) repeat protein